MRSSLLSGAASVLAAAQLCSAQTFTSCNPTAKTCPSDTALGKTITVDFTKGKSDYFTLAEGTTLTYDGTLGANFAMAVEGQAPTITSTDYIFFGKVTVRMQAAAGQGIVSSFVMESDDLDEIDWEWLGGNTAQVESNYFGKGNTSTYDRALYHSVASPQTGFHDYTIDWSNQSIIWSIDGTQVRTLNYLDANGGSNFPQTPMVIKMGNWDGGASTESPGTVEWAGGATDWSKAPFNMYVQSVTIEDAQTGATSYKYGDLTGSYESIEISRSGGTTNLNSAAPSAASTAPAGSTVSSTAIPIASGGAKAAGTSVAAASSATPSGSSSSSSSPASSESNSTSSGSKPSTPTSSLTTSSFTISSLTSPSLTPLSNTTSSSNLTVSTTPTGSSSTTTKASSSTSASAALSTSNEASSRYGSVDIAVGILGLTMGYFLM